MKTDNKQPWNGVYRACVRMAVALAIIAAPSSAIAKTDFEKEWVKHIKEIPMYIKAETMEKGEPGGEVAYKLAAIDKNIVNEAQFDLSGQVQNAQKGEKSYTIKMGNANLDLADDSGNTVKFTGELVFTYAYDKATKQAALSFNLLRGDATINGKTYLPITPKTEGRTFNIEFISDLKDKGMPMFRSNLEPLYLQRKVRVSDDNMTRNELNIVCWKANGDDAKYMPTDKELPFYEKFIRPVTTANEDMSNFKGTEKIITVYESPANLFDPSCDIAAFKNDSGARKPKPKYVETNEIYVRSFANSDNVNCSYDDANTVTLSGDGYVAVFTDGEVKSIKWTTNSTDSCLYDGKDLYRADGSVLRGIGGIGKLTERGSMPAAVRSLGSLASYYGYDLRDLRGNTLTAAGYRSPEGVEETLEEGVVIPSLHYAAETERLRGIVEERLAGNMGPDRTLERLIGPVMEVKTIVSGAKTPARNKTTSVTFDIDGYYNGPQQWVTAVTVPWAEVSRQGETTASVLVKKKPVNIYASRDDNGNLLRLTSEDPSGRAELMRENTFTWEKGQMNQRTTQGGGQTDQYVYTFDDKGLCTGYVMQGSSEGWQNKVRVVYVYKAFDDNGNWTERSVNYENKLSTADGISFGDNERDAWTETRTITYHEVDIPAEIERLRAAGE